MDQQIEPHRWHLQGRIGAWLKRPLTHKLRSAALKGRHVLRRVEDLAFEKRHRLNLGGFIRNKELDTVFAASLPHARAYEAVTCAVIAELLREAKKTGIAFDSFVDIGSGKGKACFFAAAKGGFSQIIGVEFSAPLVAVAEANKNIFGAPGIGFVNMDATAFSLPAGDNLVFLFNPFGEFILKQFLENNIERFRQSRTVIAYANDQHRLCLARLGFSTLFRNQDSQNSLYQYL